MSSLWLSILFVKEVFSIQILLDNLFELWDVLTLLYGLCQVSVCVVPHILMMVGALLLIPLFPHVEHRKSFCDMSALYNSFPLVLKCKETRLPSCINDFPPLQNCSISIELLFAYLSFPASNLQTTQSVLFSLKWNCVDQLIEIAGFLYWYFYTHFNYSLQHVCRDVVINEPRIPSNDFK